MADTPDTRKRNRNWTIYTNRDGSTPTDDAHLAVLMDIRDELQRLNRLLHCENFTGIPFVLHRIRKNTAPKRAPRKKL